MTCVQTVIKRLVPFNTWTHETYAEEIFHSAPVVYSGDWWLLRTLCVWNAGQDAVHAKAEAFIQRSVVVPASAEALDVARF